MEHDVVPVQPQHPAEALFHAVAGQAFFVCLQPRYLLPGLTIIGAEALLRWNDPPHGIRFPREFIGAAERYGYAETLDLFAFEQACLCIAQWRQAGVAAVPVSVNISTPSLYAPGFVSAVKDCIRKYEVPPALLAFEFSAMQAQEHPVALFKAIKQFHAFHCGCLIDGYQKDALLLERLCAFEIDAIKFYCGGLRPEDTDAFAACLETLSAAQQMNLPLIVEGVEDEEQLKVLIDAGCTQAQGFALSPPVTPQLFLKMLLA